MRILKISDELYPFYNYLQRNYSLSQAPNQIDEPIEEPDDGSSILFSSKLHEIESNLIQEYCGYLSKIFSSCINDRSSISPDKQAVVLFSGSALLEFYTNVCIPFWILLF